MAGAQFEYDEKGTTFYYFILCFCGLILMPITYYTWLLKSDKEEENKSLKVCRCERCCEKRIRKSKQKPKITFLRIASRIVVVLLWIALLYAVYRVSQFERDFTEYEPFSILELDKGASTAEIKRQYRKLSLLYHPDKESGDETKFMRIAKAYEALTNEESRKNWEEYGNPDGPQATTFGIALPSWIVSEENSLLVLGAYIFAFMIVLPVAVGTWWYRSIKYGNDQVLMETTGIYLHFFAKTPCMPLKRVIMIFSSAMEFDKRSNQEVQERPSDNVELPKLFHELKNVNENTRQPPFGRACSVKCRTLVLAHVERLPIPQDTLQKDLELILKKSPLLIQEMVNCICQLFYYHKADALPKPPNLDTLENVMKFSQSLMQATGHTKSPFLQLPHVLQEHLRYFAAKKRNVKSIAELLKMKKSARRDMLRFLSDEQYNDVILVAQMIPYIEVNVKALVMDDEDEGVITAGAVVTVDIELTRKTLKDVCSDGTDEEDEHAGKPEAPAEDENAAEDNKAASKNKVWHKTNRKPKKAKPVKQQAKKKPAKQAAKQKVEPQSKEEEKEGKAEDGKDNVIKKEKDELKKRSSGKREKRKKSDDLDNEDIDDDDIGDDESEVDEESDDGSASGRSGSDSEVDLDDDDEWQRMQEGVNKLEKVLDTKSRTSHEVHAPFFPEDKQEWWWVYICDRRKQEIITVPTQVVNLKDTETVKLQYQAPTKCGHYTYTVVVRSDSYMNVDVSKNFKIDVQEAKEIETKQWDFDTDEDEDKDNESGESEWDEEEEESD